MDLNNGIRPESSLVNNNNAELSSSPLVEKHQSSDIPQPDTSSETINSISNNVTPTINNPIEVGGVAGEEEPQGVASLTRKAVDHNQANEMIFRKRQIDDFNNFAEKFNNLVY